MDMDLDLDELDGVSHAPSGPSRFAPKNSRFKPKPRKQQLDSSFILPTAKEDSATPLIMASNSGEIAKVKMQSSCTYASNRDNVVKMDTDLQTEDNQTEGDLMKEGNHKDEDPVVRDIDVFFTPSVGPNTLLYVMQYPLRSCWRTYELDGQCEEVRVKPASSEVEIDLLVPDSESGEWMTKQVLSSSWVPYRSGYAVGALIGNKLYLNPMHAAAQFRPSMQHFGSEQLGKKKILSHDGGAPAEEKSFGPSKNQKKQAGNANEALTDSVKEWIHLKYHSSNSNVSDKYLHKMVAEEGSEIEFAMSSSDYIDSLCPGLTNRLGGPSKRPALSDWKFKEPTDMSFVQLYPDIVEEQEQAWETRGVKLNTQICGERSGNGINNPSKMDAKKGVPKNSSKTPAKKSISDETREALIKALQKLFQSNKICRYLDP